MSTLHEITSHIQEKNKTRAFLCSRTGVIYTSHYNGYIRRQLMNGKQYQLNPVVKTKTKNNGYKYQRVMILDENRRIEIIRSRALSYKNNS